MNRIGVIFRRSITPRRLAVLVLGTLAAVAVVVIVVALTIYIPYRQALSDERSRLARALQVQEILLPQLLSGQPRRTPGAGTAVDRSEEWQRRERAEFILDRFGPATVFYVVRRDGAQTQLLFASRENPGFGGGEERLASSLSNVLAQAQGGTEGTLTTEDDAGRGMLFAYRTLADSDLALAATLPLSAIREPAIHSVVIDSLLWVVTLAVLGLLYYFLNPTGRFPTVGEPAFRSIVEATQDGILLVDRQGAVRLSNPAARELFGLGRLEAGRKRIDDFWAEPERVRRETGIGLFLAGGEPDWGPTRMVWGVASRGEKFPVAIRAGTLREANEDLLLLNLCDVSQQVQVEQALVEARKAAERAAQDRALLLANISHEIRNPISGVIGMLDLLRISEPGPEQEKYLELAHSAAAGLLTLANEVLDWARIEGGRTECEAIVFGPSELLAEVAEAFEVRANARGIELDWLAGAGVPGRVVGDPTHLKRVLSNLVDNAIKFTERGSVRLSVELLEQVQDIARLRFEVADSGPGIPESVGNRIFEPFHQGEASTERKHGGSGLGLSICRSLVTMMGGELGYESAEGDGAVFWFQLGLAAAGEQSGPAIPAAAER